MNTCRFEDSRRKGYRGLDQSDAVGGLRGEPPFNGFATPKCNIFVYDALRASQIAPPLMDGNVPRAQDWADPQRVAGYRVVGRNEPLRPGDIISNGDHVGIYTPMRVEGRWVAQTTSAATLNTGHGNPVLGGPVTNDWGFRDANGQPLPAGERSAGVVVRRYVGPSE